MHLNLGCGDRYAVGWHNVDHAGSPHPKDAEVDLREELPWPSGSITHVYAGHVLEHLTLLECHTLLTRLHHCMALAGQIMVVGPDLMKAEEMIHDGTFDYTWGHTLHSLRHGGDRWPGDVHHWACDTAKVMLLLRDAGWLHVTDVGIENVSDMWPVADRAPLWQCAVYAEVA